MGRKVYEDMYYKFY